MDEPHSKHPLDYAPPEAPRPAGRAIVLAVCYTAVAIINLLTLAVFAGPLLDWPSEGVFIILVIAMVAIVMWRKAVNAWHDVKRLKQNTPFDPRDAT